MLEPAQDFRTGLMVRFSDGGTALELFAEQRPDIVLYTIPVPGTAGGPPLMADGVPTSDPAVAGQVWSNLGVLTVSAG